MITETSAFSAGDMHSSSRCDVLR